MKKKINIMGFNGNKSKGGIVLDPILDECVFVPGAPRNLLSFSRLKDNKWHIRYDNKGDYFIARKGKIKMKFVRHEMLYTCASNNEVYNLQVEDTDMNKSYAQQARLLHNICGHPSDKMLKKMITNGTLTNVKIKPKYIDLAKKILGPCAACVMGKGTKYRSKTSSEPKSKVIGEIIHIDIFYFGSKTLKESFLISIDEASGYVITMLLKNTKTEDISQALKQIIAFYSSYQHVVKRFASDRESAVVANKTELNLMGCVLELTSSEGHNNYAERSIRNIRDRCRSIKESIKMTFEYHLPRSFNRFLIKYSTQCINMMPGSGRESSPWVMVTGKHINSRRLLRCGFGEVLLFGSTYLTTEKSNSPRAEFGIVLGVDMESKGTKTVYLLDRKQIVFRNHFWRVPIDDNTKAKILKLQNLNPNPKISEEVTNLDPKEIENPLDNMDNIATTPSIPFEIPMIRITNDTQETVENPVQPHVIASPTENLSQVQPRQSQIERRYPKRSNRSNIDYNLLNDPGLITESSSMTIKEGREIDENMANDAIDKELSQILQREVFNPILPEDVGDTSVLPSSFILSRKGNDFKGRLVGGGHRQNRKEYQVWETSSPTISIQGILSIISIAINTNSILSSVDVKGAYLFAPLKKRIIIKLPIEVSERLAKINGSYSKFVDHHGFIRVELKKALYGLIESGNLWYHHITETLKDLGFKQAHADQCIFRRGKQIIGVYVDDLLLLTDNQKEKEDLIKEIEVKYPGLKRSHGNRFTYRGLQIEQLPTKILINQKDYISQLLKDEKIIKISKVPASRNLFKKQEVGSFLNRSEQSKFQETLAKVMWIANQTRPEIKMVTSILASRVQNPDTDDQAKLKKVLEYLNGTKDLGLVFTKASTNLRAYADAAHLVHPDCRGHSGAVILMGKNIIHCESKKQKLVSQSSTEAELVSLNSCLNGVLWLRNLMNELGFEQVKTKIYQDNMSCITMANNGRPTRGTKHMKMRYFHVKSKMTDGTVQVKYKDTKRMLADVLTKPIESSKIFARFRDKLLGTET